VKRGKVDIKKLKVRYKGFHEHRLKDNPLEAQIAMAWQAANDAASCPGGIGTTRDLADSVVCVPGRGIALDYDAKVAATVLQWLGSPVGFAWLVDTLGLEIVREMQMRPARGQAPYVEPGQTYQFQGKRGGRKVTVEKLRHGVGTPLFRMGPSTHWTVRNSETGRRSYVYERILLDRKVWMQTK